jgi:hypothetical protein
MRIVCAALRKDGRIIAGARHFDEVMRQQIRASEGVDFWRGAEQGFLTNYGQFLDRKRALVIAMKNRQVVEKIGNGKILFSEDLY